jgi:hypothetical protein
MQIFAVLFLDPAGIFDLFLTLKTAYVKKTPLTARLQWKVYKIRLLSSAHQTVTT